MLILANSFTDLFTQYFDQSNWLEFAGVITGILCVWLAAKNNIANWPVAIVSVLIYMYIFFVSKLYADAGLQVYFLVMNVYGWYFWSRQRNNPQLSRPVTQIKKRELICSAIGIAAFTALLGFFLHNNTDASFPFIDSFCTACSLVAQILLARKVLQNWLIWIFVDIIYVYVYASKNLYATAFMYALYIYIALMGYLEWKKSYREQES